MNSMTKTALIGAGILSMSALAACQSASTAKEMQHPQKTHGPQHERGMTPEQHQQMQRMRAERHDMMQQIRQACSGKAPGAAVQAAAGGKTLDGTCIMGFKADKQALGRHDTMPDGHRAMHGSMHGSMHMQRGEPLTDAKRAELTKQFDQRLAQRQAMQQAVQKACQGKADGAAVQIKAGAQTIDGKCEVRFQPKMPMQPAAPAPAKAM
ncbi:hypothetical protein [Acinetobacter sp.]|uniref:hypothetical protein n=1 Tax=Acinetobacter sp. TaxID=472 RepID=UPI0035B09DA8